MDPVNARNESDLPRVTFTAWRIQRGRHCASCLVNAGGRVVGEIFRYAPDVPFRWVVQPEGAAPVSGEARTLVAAKHAARAACRALA